MNDCRLAGNKATVFDVVRRIARRVLLTAATFLPPGISMWAGDIPSRGPVPDAAAQEKASALVRELYEEEYAKAKTSAQKLAVAKKLLLLAAESQNDPAGRFVLLRICREMAVQAGETETALEAVDAIAESFEVDVLRMKVAEIAKLAESARFTTQNKALATAAAGLIEEAIAGDDYEAAGQLVDIGLSAARRARARDLTKSAAAAKKNVEKAARAYAQVRPSLATLETSPSDPDANLAVGKYFCFVKGDWEKGIPMLALGSDQALKMLAVKEKELEGPSSLAEQVELADGWWQLAQKEKGNADLRNRLLLHAGSWYRRAETRLTAGLEKVKVRQRLEEIAEIERPAADVPAGSGRGPAEAKQEFVSLFDGKTLNGWRPMRFEGGQPGERDWVVHEGVLICTTNQHGWLRSDRQYGDFVLDIEFKVPPKGNSGVLIRHPGIDDLSSIEIQIIDDGPGRLPDKRSGAILGVVGPAFSALGPAGSWNAMRIVCRGDQVGVALNGRPVANANMSQHDKLRKLPRAGFIGLYNWRGQAVGTAFRNIRLLELTTAGRRD